MSDQCSELVEISKLNGDFRKNYGKLLGLSLSAIRQRRARPFLVLGRLGFVRLFCGVGLAGAAWLDEMNLALISGSTRPRSRREPPCDGPKRHPKASDTASALSDAGNDHIVLNRLVGIVQSQDDHNSRIDLPRWALHCAAGLRPLFGSWRATRNEMILPLPSRQGLDHPLCSRPDPKIGPQCLRNPRCQF